MEPTDVGELETCLGCGQTVEVDSPTFLEWDADVVGSCRCPDCLGEGSEPGSRRGGDDLRAGPFQVVELRLPGQAA